MQAILLFTVVWSAIVTAAMAQTPVLTEIMNFAPIPVGARRELRLKVGQLPSGGYYQLSQSPNQPFTITSDAKDLEVKGNDIELRVAFAPTAPGDFRDEIILQRVPQTGQTSVDVIRVRLFGTAFVIERTDVVDFGGVMTGDTAKQVVLYRVNRNDDFTFEYAGELLAPFRLLTAQGPMRRGSDTLAVAMAFSPRTAGSYVDTIGVVRKDRLGRRLDTAFIIVSGKGKTMPEQSVLDLRDLVAGDYANRTITVDVPEKVITVNFSYSIEPRAVASYVTASITAPTTPSKARQIAINVLANPPKKVQEQSTFMLLRKGLGDTVLDSTEIVVDVQTSARPVRFTASFDADTINARIGDTLDLRIRASTADPIDEAVTLTSLRFDLLYNPTVFVPLPSANQNLSVVNDQQVLSTDIDATVTPIIVNGNRDIIATVRGVVALGDADRSSIAVSNCTFTRANGISDTLADAGALLRITNVWRYADGRVRLANPLRGMLSLDIDPNPVVSASTLRLQNLAQGAGSLVIIDALGIIREDLTSELRGGRREFTIASSGTADIVLPAGTYYARCMVESALGGTINSTVRMFVVQ
jgi:hypothetical protein